MLSGGFQSSAYKKLLARQQEEDEERNVKIEELRRKQLREDIKRKREEEDARKKAQAAKISREQELKQAKLDAENAERRKLLKREEEERKRPLSVEEARERRERAEVIRNAGALSKAKQALPPASKVLSSKYSSLLATAPTKLDTSSPLRNKSPGALTPKAGQKPATNNPRVATKIPSSAPKRPTDTTSSGAAGASSTSTSSPGPKLAEKRQSQYLQPKSNGIGTKRLPAGVADLQPLQKNKRDLRTIEEIQNDVHRRNGKNYAYLTSSTTGLSKTPTKGASRLPNEQKPSTTSVGPRSKSTITNPIRTKPPPKRSRRDSHDSEDSFVSRTSPPRQRDNGLGGESIWDILNPGKKRDAYLARDIDSDEDMEANAEDIRREEQRASRAARVEDEKEAALLRAQEARKAAKKRKLAAS
ncbi:protein of unknown function [Taphrina deformans PYCC 5710]|uniref:SPT2 chromatin protein n=1 Tax=Taphrina deformans (strain PYCC 5710 / ATCC 11124 / CBS 356.35 / IMI 108563 / JCM 9778 / NBRC 8474) TaxID=1097556 RepID=R4XFL1_TAPDE|nr:protein of unknown function [Taphrina deformans PYCC 5710]|eukprot:CCG84641.1 protein of unknown function [Taphrina deformans PYCC 5710]